MTTKQTITTCLWFDGNASFHLNMGQMSGGRLTLVEDLAEQAVSEQ